MNFLRQLGPEIDDVLVGRPAIVATGVANQWISRQSSPRRRGLAKKDAR